VRSPFEADIAARTCVGEARSGDIAGVVEGGMRALEAPRFKPWLIRAAPHSQMMDSSAKVLGVRQNG
jgi:hypothetical protein